MQLGMRNAECAMMMLFNYVLRITNYALNFGGEFMFLKKFFSVILLLAIMTLPQNVSAEKTDWFDRNFYFRNIRTVIVFDVTANRGTNYGGDISMLNMQDTFVQNAKKHLKCNIITEREARLALGHQLGMDLESLAYSNPQNARKIVEENAYRIADAGIFANIDAWENNYYIEPAHTVWESKRETYTYYDRHGRRHEETRYIQVPVTYPPQRVDISTIQVSLQVYDSRNLKMVFARKDVRDRQDYQAQKGMFGRICNSFFEDFSQKLR